jgi:hypothetical protein
MLKRWADRWNANIILYDGYPNFATVAWNDKRVWIDMHYLEHGPRMLGRMVYNMPPGMTGPTAIVAVVNRRTWLYSGKIPAVERSLQSMYQVPVKSVVWGGKHRCAELESAVREFLSIDIRIAQAADTGIEPAK